MTEKSPPRIPLAAVDRECAALRETLVSVTTSIVESGRFILGPQVEAFEREVGEALGAHAVTCANGTDALVLALRALEIGPGDEVIVPAFTFAATAEAVVLTGATPVFADILPDTFGIDPRSVEALVGPLTRAVIPVHLFGLCVPMEPLWHIADRSSLRIIEDAAQAIGAKWRGKAAGALGHVAAFSFYPTKNLGAAGDGGMLTTTDARIAERLRILRAHGSRGGYLHEAIGLNSRLDELQAGILRAKLPHLHAWNEKRRATAERYRAALARTEIAAPCEIEGAHHIYHHFTFRTRARDELMASFDRQGVSCGIYYPQPLHQQPAYARWARGSLPEAERAAAEVVSVPVHQWLTEEEIGRVAEALASAR